MEKEEITMAGQTDTLSFETKNVEEISAHFSTDLKNGLSSEEAKIRLEKYGPNKLEEKKKKTWFQIFIEQMKNPMIYVLFAAIAVTICVSIYEVIHTSDMIASGAMSGEGIIWFLDVGDWP